MTVTTNYKPSLEDVSTTLRARCVDGYGNHQETFNDVTTPNAAQANAQIEEALAEVGAEIGVVVPEDRIDQAKRLTQILAAANIELSYYPEQSAASNSIYDKLMERYNTLLPKYGEDIGEDAAEEVGVAGAHFGFPPSSNFGKRAW